MLIAGEYLGGTDVRERYLLGSQFARDLRALPGKEHQQVFGSYGYRSYLYAEMVFGNTVNVSQLIAATPGVPIHAMRTPRVLTLTEIVKRTDLPAGEIRRFNPALGNRVPAGATLYLPLHISEFGPDVAFWRRPASPAYAAVLDEFLRLEPGAERWDDPAFAPVLADFKRRFRETNTEEGRVMETVLAYAMDQVYRALAARCWPTIATVKRFGGCSRAACSSSTSCVRLLRCGRRHRDCRALEHLFSTPTDWANPSGPCNIGQPTDPFLLSPETRPCHPPSRLTALSATGPTTPISNSCAATSRCSFCRTPVNRGRSSAPA